MTPVDVVLFDWGHTLFETGSSVEFVVQWAAANGRPLSRSRVDELWEDARQRSRTPEEIAKGRDLSPVTHRECWLALWTELDAAAPGVAEALYVYEISAEGWQPYLDTRDVLETLAEHGTPVVIVSDVPFDLRPIFDHYGLRHLVREFVLSGEHGTIKPDGVLFSIALAAAGGIAPERALMVGDNVANDGAAARYGIRTLLLPVTPTGEPRGLDAVTRLLGF